MGAVAPSPAPALSAGPLPYPVMLGSDPGVLGFLILHFSLIVCLNTALYSD